MQKQYTLARTIAATTLITIFSSSTLMAAECEFSGLNLIRAYNKAVNNGARFECLAYDESKSRYLSSPYVRFLPIPTGLRCFHKSIPQGMLHPIVVLPKDFRFLAFGKPGTWPLNGWKLSKYQISGGGTKKATRSGGIVIQTSKPPYSKWSVSIKKIWLKKAGASCSNITNILTSAFGE